MDRGASWAIVHVVATEQLIHTVICFVECLLVWVVDVFSLLEGLTAGCSLLPGWGDGAESSKLLIRAWSLCDQPAS